MKKSEFVQKFFPCCKDGEVSQGKGLLYCESNSAGQADILMLHGGGVVSGLHNYNWLRTDLLNFGITSCSFDFAGHGRSCGALIDSSLAQRTEEAYEVAASKRLRYPMTVVGASMGAYIALKLTEHCAVNALILFVPAVYSKHAYEARFGDEFTRIIRQPLSWMDSDAWEIIGRYTGSLVIITAEKDDIVPQEIPIRLFDSANNARERFLYTVPKSPHKILSYLQDAPNDRILVADLVRKCHEHDL